jgi:hypothetical protein
VRFSQGKSIRIGTKQREDWILAPGTLAFGDSWGNGQRFGRDRGAFGEVYGAARTEETTAGEGEDVKQWDCSAFLSPFRLMILKGILMRLMILKGILMERSRAEVGCFRRAGAEIGSAI